MLHQGKNYPFTLRKDMIRRFGWPDNWCRKWWMHVGTGFGSKGALWTGITLFSELADEQPSTGFLRWKFIHPTHSDQEVHFVVLVEEESIGPPWNTETFFHFEAQYYDAGTFRGRTGPINDQPVYDPAVLFLSSGFFWTDLTDVSKFASLFNTTTRAAKWSECPDYHPYRTRP